MFGSPELPYLLDKNGKKISLMKINNIILALRTHTILLSSCVIYFLYICHSGSFPVKQVISVNLYFSLGQGQ